MAAALSDLAAMGAAPGEAYVQLGIPTDLDESGSVELATGLGRAAAANGVAVIGGDVTRAPVLLLALTVVGHAADADELVLRSGARPGDVVAVTGELGGAAAGLVLLQRPELAADLGEEVAVALRGRQLEPWPRLAAGRDLAKAGATAMIDLSDGLGGDAAHVARASSAGLAIELDTGPSAGTQTFRYPEPVVPGRVYRAASPVVGAGRGRAEKEPGHGEVASAGRIGAGGVGVRPAGTLSRLFR